jgi:hypothetical protein
MSARDFLDSLAAQAGDALTDAAGNLSVAVKTNLGPEITVWDGSASDGEGGTPSTSLAEILGVKAAVIVRAGSGRVLKQFGDYPATDPVRVVIALAALGMLLFVLVRGVLPR